MAGGIFVDQPFYLNPKCVVISIFCMICYWFLPYRNPFMLPIIFLISYILIAWYDYLYNCEQMMYSGTSPLNTTAWAKPQRRTENTNNNIGVKISKNQEEIYKKKIYGLHFLFIAPLLFYLGYYKNKSNPYIWPVVGTISLMVLVYHGLRIFYPRKTENASVEKMLIIYLFHIIFVFPLLFYIYWKKDKSDNRVWTPLLLLSIFLFMYHLFRFIL